MWWYINYEFFGHTLFSTHIILTSCTSRKRGLEESLRLTDAIVGSDLSDTAERWIQALADREQLSPALSRYLGRSITEAKIAASFLDAQLYVASAGLGLISGEDLIPQYDLTTSGKNSSLQAVLDRYGATSSQWWDAVCRNGGISELLAKNSQTMVLAALPASYISMIAEDLMRSNSRDLSRLRIFTSRAGVDALPPVLAKNVMPYDERLESIQGCAGTRADFPQRALKHFVTQLRGHLSDVESGYQKVNQFLSIHRAPQSIARQRATDEDIKHLIHKHWATADGKGSTLLRSLRDVSLVACEQSRFARLWHEVRAERSDPGTKPLSKISK
jgi:hypothetical protein